MGREREQGGETHVITKKVGLSRPHIARARSRSLFLSLSPTDRCGKVAEHPAVPARETIGFLLEVAILLLHSLDLGPDEDKFTDNILGKKDQMSESE